MYQIFEIVAIFVIVGSIIYFISAKLIAGIRRFKVAEKITSQEKPEKKCPHCGK